MLSKAKGYHIVVTTWENDGDNYATESVHFADRTEAENAVKIIRMFTSRNNSKNPGIGNLQERDTSKIFEAFHKLIEENPGIIPVSIDDIEEDNISPYDLLEFVPDVGIGSSEYYLTRVVDKIVVEYYPEDVHCEDLTAEFNADVSRH
jgi:hypothetical protein